MTKSKIAILTDSGCNIKEDINKNIFVVPLYITNGTESKKDLVEIKPEDLYSRMDEENFKTAAPSVDDFKEKISYIKSLGYEKIIGIAMSSNLSGTLNSMKMGLENSNIDYLLLDSKYASVGSGLLVSYGSNLIEEGEDFKEIYEILKKKRSDIRILGCVSDLKYLIRGGRISHLKGLIGSVLKITPILAIKEDGKIEKFKSLRGEVKAISFMTKYVKKELDKHDKYYMATAYGKNIEDIGPLKESLMPYIKKSDFYMEEALTSVLATHTGPHICIVSYMFI